jgi:hypothetical protein
MPNLLNASHINGSLISLVRRRDYRGSYPASDQASASCGHPRDRGSEAAAPSATACQRRSRSPRTGLTLRRTRSRRRQVRASSLSPAVPLAGHKERARAVSSGQSRSLRGGRWAGRPSLTWDRGGGRNCMACKGSCAPLPVGLLKRWITHLDGSFTPSPHFGSTRGALNPLH